MNSQFHFLNSVTYFTSLKQEKLVMHATVLRSGNIEYVLYISDRLAGSAIEPCTDRLQQLALLSIAWKVAELYELFEKNGYPEYPESGGDQ